MRYLVSGEGVEVDRGIRDEEGGSGLCEEDDDGVEMGVGGRKREVGKAVVGRS